MFVCSFEATVKGIFSFISSLANLLLFYNHQPLIFKFLFIYLLTFESGRVYPKYILNAQYGRSVGSELDLPADCRFRAARIDYLALSTS